MNGVAILTALHEVLTQGTGTLRIIPAATFDDELYEELDDQTKSARAIDRPLIESTVTVVEPHPSTPMRESSKSIDMIEVQIRCLYHIGPKEMVNTTQRIAAKGQPITDGNTIKQALQYRQNLAATAALTSTGIVSGLLMHQRTEFLRVQLDGDQAGLIEVLHTYSGAVEVQQVTS